MRVGACRVKIVLNELQSLLIFCCNAFLLSLVAIPTARLRTRFWNFNLCDAEDWYSIHRQVEVLLRNFLLLKQFLLLMLNISILVQMLLLVVVVVSISIIVMIIRVSLLLILIHRTHRYKLRFWLIYSSLVIFCGVFSSTSPNRLPLCILNFSL